MSLINTLEKWVSRELPEPQRAMRVEADTVLLNPHRGGAVLDRTHDEK